MATLAASQINYNFGVLEIDGWPIEMYRVPSPVSNGDTITIAPNRFRRGVKAAFGGPTCNDLPASGTPATNVTFTAKLPAGTHVGFDVVIVGFQGG